jgi:uncharacterized protein YegP (UPF0339 family)
MRTMSKLFMPAVLLIALAGVTGVSLAPGQGKDKGKDPLPAVFEVYKDNSDMYRYRLVLDDEKLAIAAHGYKTKEEVMKVIDAVRKEAPKAKVVEIKAAK